MYVDGGNENEKMRVGLCVQCSCNSPDFIPELLVIALAICLQVSSTSSSMLLDGVDARLLLLLLPAASPARMSLTSSADMSTKLAMPSAL